MTLKNRLIKVLNQTKGEREIHAFLKEEPYLVWGTFMDCAGHSDDVIPEFSLGGKYRPDFVVMQSFSGGWNIAFIELEPVDAKPFNKNGNLSKRLNDAMTQIDNWKNFANYERASLCSCLADAAQKEDTLYPERNLAREPSAKMPLRDPRTYLNCEYYIVMGRRSHFDEKFIHKKAKFKSNHKVELLTYDRFVDAAEKLNRPYKFYKKRIIEDADQEFLAEFERNPELFLSNSRDGYKYPNEITIDGTNYKLESEDDENSCRVYICGTPYIIYEDRFKFRLDRVEPYGLTTSVVNNMKSISAVIQFAEIYERLINFSINTEHSLDLVDEFLQGLINNPPYKNKTD